MKENYVLIGMMGSGKSTVGKLLAGKLNYGFLDLDASIEEKQKATIQQLVLEKGMPHFRELESAALGEIKTVRQSVVSTGGGIVLSANNRFILKELGCLVWLKASPQTILERTKNDTGRPLLVADSYEEKLQTIERILRERAEIYAGLADLTLEVDDLSPVEVVQKIIDYTV